MRVLKFIHVSKAARSNAEPWCFLWCYTKQAIEWISELTMGWDRMTLMWGYNDILKNPLFFLLYFFAIIEKKITVIHKDVVMWLQHVCNQGIFTSNPENTISVWLIVKLHHNIIKTLFGEFSKSYISDNCIRLTSNCVTYEQSGKVKCRSHFVYCIPVVCQKIYALFMELIFNVGSGTFRGGLWAYCPPSYKIPTLSRLVRIFLPSSGAFIT